VDTGPLNILEWTSAELAGEFNRRYGKGAYHARAVYRHVFRSGPPRLDSLPELNASPGLLERVKTDLVFPTGRVVGWSSEEGVIKFVTRLGDGFDIESVIIPRPGRYTVCVSSQAGCRMGCAFCQTARLGFHRNLTVPEIVGQVLSAKQVFGIPVRNVVFMGMGEPLDNPDAVLRAVRILSDPIGLGIGIRHMTVSTVGLPDQIRALAAVDGPGFNLAVSLNAADARTRSRIMPVNRRWPLPELKAALLDYSLKRVQAVFIEYVLISGVNDGRGAARQLCRWLKPLRTKINVIPLNPTPAGRFQAPSEPEVDRFCGWLAKEGLFVRRRSARGRTVAAACGQLGGARQG